MIIGIIPARGGSKGIPRKNIKEIAGFPLIYWTIEAAKNSSLLDDFYVSTEDQEIAEIAYKYGAKVLLRPEFLAQDETTTLQVLTHITSELECEDIVVLQPTSPIRNDDTIDDCIREYRTGNYDTLATGYFTKIIEYGSHQNIRRQDINGFFYDDGNVYILNKNIIKANRWSGEKICRKILDKELNFEIDDPIEFQIIEFILKMRIETGSQQTSVHKTLQNIGLLVMDVDGVLTDAGMYYTEAGDELKKFNTRDGMGIKLIKEKGIKTAIITSENTMIVKNRALKLGIDFLYQGVKDKKSIIQKLSLDQHIPLERIAFIGDDINDVEALKIVGVPITVKNATFQNKRTAKIITPQGGGEGCVRFICDLICQNNY